MRTQLVVFAASLCVAGFPLSVADEQEVCPEIHALAAMMRAPSIRALNEARKRAPAGYRVDLVAAFRAFQLQPGSAAAADRLLRLIPSDDSQQESVMTLDSSLCDAESITEMTVLARVPEKYAAQLAKAVLLSPRHMAEYVKYSTIAIGDPHSDFPPQMAHVCRRTHRLFLRGLNQLSESDKEFVIRQVIQPATCKALALPEAD